MDNFLMLRYESEQEIVDAMNVEIKQLNYDRRLVESTHNSMLDAYRGQIRVAANKQRAGAPVSDEVSQEIAEMRVKISQNQNSLAKLDNREGEIRQEFQVQLDRYRYLVEKYAEEPSG
jgi:predicted ribosome quality control (RQC) complex YloA/Tae2 family protein